MLKGRAVLHLWYVFHWTHNERVEATEVLIASLGMAVPVLAGFLSGHDAAGFAAALGGLTVSGVQSAPHVRNHALREIEVLLPTVLGAAAAIGIAISGASAIMLIGMAILAALFGGFSRGMAVGSTRFTITLMIVSAVPNLSLSRGGDLLLLIILGAAWASALRLGFVALRPRTEPTMETQSRQSSPAQKLKHLIRSLKSVSGWTYTLQLGFCLSVAAVLQAVWPHHHFHWIGLTTVLLTSRRPKANAVKTTQRTLGTGLGVLVADIALRFPLPAAGTVALIAVLAGARSQLKNRNYLVYSVAMTLLLVLLIDGRAPELSLLVDRLFATVIASALVTFTDSILSKAG